MTGNAFSKPSFLLRSFHLVVLDGHGHFVENKTPGIFFRKFYARFLGPLQKTTTINGSRRLLKQHLGNALQTSTFNELFNDLGLPWQVFSQKCINETLHFPLPPSQKKNTHLGVWPNGRIVHLSPRFA